MTKENFRIVYMGTPEFAVTILDELIKNEYNVVAVITAPDKPAAPPTARGLASRPTHFRWAGAAAYARPPA